ncbi:ATP-binding cassette domain-containing protein [Glaciihabitans tibetensis]|uniref:ATP-binding cassette domain-containing protein n=1 Tax=Glaciihabitans tibetensis TaxID=1266600 RepID=UPI0011B2239C|nr:ATP-binding cassette domain-containing protein [Glaciihabitans tibetensis]
MSQSVTGPAPVGRPARVPAVSARDLCIASAPSIARPQMLSFDADTGDLLVIEGRAQSGKTALLLTLAGRMKQQSGRLTVLGFSLPVQAGAVRAVTGLGVVQGVNDLDASLTVEQHVAERVIFHQSWWRPRVTRATVESYLQRANAVLQRLGASPLLPVNHTRPPTLVGHRFVGDLAPLDQFVLGTTLALIGDPQLLIIDDIDALREHENRLRAWSALLALVGARRTLTVAVSCEDATDLGDLFAHDPAERLARSRVKIVRMN